MIHFYNPVVWYIVALAWWKLFFALIPDSCLNDEWKLLLGTIVLSLVVGWIPYDHTLVFQRTFAFFPYFVLGYFAKQKKWLDRLKATKWYYSALVILMYCLIICLVHHIPLSMLEQCFSYWSIGNNPVLIMAMRGFSYFWQLPLALAVIRLIMKMPKNHWFVAEGKYTLFIYVYHAYLVYFIHKFVVVYNWNSSLLNMMLYLFVVMVALFFLRKIPILNKLLSPIRIFSK